jgi:hypothetical protein
MSEIRTNTVSNAAGTGPVTLTGQVAAKARYNYNQATNTIAGSFNLSSITDVSTGQHDPSFTSAFSTTGSMAAAGSVGTPTTNGLNWGINDNSLAFQTTTFRVITADMNNSLGDAALCLGIVHGDLA